MGKDILKKYWRILAKNFILLLSFILTFFFLHLIYPGFEECAIHDKATRISKVIIIISLFLTLVISFWQYNSYIGHNVPDNRKKNNTLRILIIPLFIIVIMLTASFFSDFLMRPITVWKWGYVFPYVKNLSFIILAIAVIISDSCIFSDSTHKQNILKEDMSVLTSIIAVSFMVGIIKENYSPDLKIYLEGFNSGVLSFHVILATLLFEPINAINK